MRTAKEWLFENYPNVKEDWGMTGHDDNFTVRMMDEYAKQAWNEAVELCSKECYAELFDFSKKPIEKYRVFAVETIDGRLICPIVDKQSILKLKKC